MQVLGQGGGPALHGVCKPIQLLRKVTLVRAFAGRVAERAAPKIPAATWVVMRSNPAAVMFQAALV